LVQASFGFRGVAGRNKSKEATSSRCDDNRQITTGISLTDEYVSLFSCSIHDVLSENDLFSLIKRNLVPSKVVLSVGLDDQPVDARPSCRFS
jgi:hypothetical protein